VRLYLGGKEDLFLSLISSALPAGSCLESHIYIQKTDFIKSV
jgi:hypothetical protein